MKDYYKYILENVSNGKIEKQVAIDILTMLKTIEQEKKLDYGKRSKEDIAVIGMAVKLPKADSTEEFWYNIKNGIDCISDFPASRRGDTDKAVKAMYSREGNVLYNIGGYLNEIDKFDCSFFKLSPKEASLMDPSQRLLLQTTVNAIENAGYGGTKITGTKTGVYVGYSSDFGESYKGYAEWSENTFTGFTLTGNIESILAGRISYTLDLKGPSIVVDTACSSSLVAVHLACQGLRTGDCDMAVAGGVNINLLPLKTNSSQRIGIESSTSRARTFDDSSDGTGFGEGVAVVFLKPLNKAIDDGDIIHAVIKGTAVNQDGSSSGITAPNSAAQEEVILKAWKDANINPETITYIEAHGTGTRLGDPIEVEGIRRAFGQHIKKKQFCGIGSVKTNIGHLDNAAGIAGLIKVIMALKNKQLPPTLNFSRPNSHIDFENSPVYICNRLRRWETAGIPRRCGVNSFGLSGTNCHVVVEESPSLHEKGSGEGNKDMPYVLAISALSEEALKTLVTRYRHYIKNYITVDGNFLKNMCFTASTGRDHHTFRLALIIRDCKELADKLDKMIASDIRSYEREGIYYGRHRITADPGSAQTSGEISMDGIRQMSEQANRKIKEFVDSGQCKDDELSRLCELYIQGAAVQWEILFKGIDCKRTELPEYPFERKRCWLKGPDEFESANTTGEVDMFHTILWKKVSEERFSVHSNQGGVLVLCNGSDMGREITAGIREAGREVILAEFGDTFSKISDDRYIVGKSMHDYTRLIAEVSGRQLSKVLYITISMDTMEPETIRELHEIQQRGVFSFLNLIRALLQSENKQKVDFLLVSQNVNQVTGSEENLSPWQAPLFGLGRVIPKEYRKFAIRCLDIDSKTTVEDIIAELDRTAKDYIIAYRDGNKYVETLENVVLSREATDKVVIKRNGVYIITGGTGGIGLEIGQYLAEKENVKLALISRSQFPVKNEWKMEEEKGGKRAKQIKKIREIEETGSVVELCEADVSNWDDMKKCVNFLREKYGRINGIIHCAGVAGDGFIFKKDETVFKDVLNPKVFGTWILDKLTEDDEPDFFVMFSSMESLIGRAGQGDYTSANSFLDAYAAYRNNQGKRTFVINWPAWKDTGMAYDYGVISGIEFLKPMDISEAINAFDRVLHSGIQRVIPGELNIRVLRESSTGTNINIPDIVNDYIVRKNSGERVPSERCSIDRRSNYTAVKINGRESGSYTETEKRLADVWGGMLDIEEINVNDRFNEIGGNSIIAVGMEVELEKMGILADASDIDKYPTLAEFAAFLDSKSCGEGISKNKAETSPEAFSLVHTLDCNSEKPSLEATVSNEVILEGIEPFNDVYYKSCFYNSLFPVVKYFRKDVLAFLTNQIIAYDYSDNSKIPLSVSYHSIKDNSIILNEIGIIAHAKNTSQDIIYDITSSITEGKPVILWVDSYYEPIRNDTFHKKHLAHSWLIYGFNETKRECYIIEHRHSDSLAYEKCVLGYDDVINSYEGFINNFQNDMTRIPSYSNYSLYSDEEINGNKNSQLNHLHVFGENYLKYKDIVLKGLENIKLFQEIYTTIVEDEKVLSENVVPLINCLNEVINIKKVESYRARMIFRPKTDYAQIVDEITEYWDLIRKKLARYMYSSVYKPEELILTGKVINTIYIMEHRHHKMLSGDFIIKRNDSYIF